MNIHAHKEIRIHTAGGDEDVRIFWRHFYEDDNTYAVQFILHFPAMTIDCVYCFTDGFTHTMIINTETVFKGELYDQIMPLFRQIYADRALFH
ncbi:MAG: hypothetical protein INR69_19370 [Mucilaginibacter polytrichastri]|nr:hypothetical protein [Mucilaginibacter polytrichastri]